MTIRVTNHGISIPEKGLDLSTKLLGGIATVVFALFLAAFLMGRGSVASSTSVGSTGVVSANPQGQTVPAHIQTSGDSKKVTRVGNLLVKDREAQVLQNPLPKQQNLGYVRVAMTVQELGPGYTFRPDHFTLIDSYGGVNSEWLSPESSDDPFKTILRTTEKNSLGSDVRVQIIFTIPKNSKPVQVEYHNPSTGAIGVIPLP